GGVRVARGGARAGVVVGGRRALAGFHGGLEGARSRPGSRALWRCGDASGAPTLANARGSRQRDPARHAARSFRSQANCAVFSAMAAVLDPCAKATLPSSDSAPRISIMPEAAASCDVGTYFGKYFLMKKLAAGGMGEVFLAKQQGPAGFQKMLVVKKILSHLTESKELFE